MQTFQWAMPVRDSLNANQRLHWAERDRRRQLIDGHVRLAARGLQPQGRATVLVAVVKATAGRYDAANLQQSVKPAVDALVRMGVLDEDSNEYVSGPLIVEGGLDRALAARRSRGTVERVKFKVFLLPWMGAQEIIDRLVHARR